MNSGVELPKSMIDPDHVPRRQHYCPSETEINSSETTELKTELSRS